jgi:glycosyltransferase involved in cell wall biosynthesis
MLPPLRYIVPVHNDEATLAASVETLVTELGRRPPSRGSHEVLLIENGSSDKSYEVAKGLSGKRGDVQVHAFTESNAGIGYAYDRGLREALALGGDRTERWCVLTASDLPFSFTDLDAFERWIEQRPSVRVAIGSKAHPDSVIQVTRARGTMTMVYRAARRVILGMRTGDSQGSFFVREDFAAEVVPRIESRDFFYTTELVYFAERSGERPVELPVRNMPESRQSTVRPWKHGSRMLLALLELRRRSR